MFVGKEVSYNPLHIHGSGEKKKLKNRLVKKTIFASIGHPHPVCRPWSARVQRTFSQGTL
jgi:hypothetical protein